METLKEIVRSLPHEPGVYIYRDSTDTVIYIGKARDLSRRVKQYFQRDDAVGEKTVRLVSEIRRIEIIRTTSEFDALLLEAKLIRQYQPKYNVIAKDDKSPLYVVITFAEALPRLLLIRKGEIPLYNTSPRNAIYGPFQSGYALRSLLRQLRAIVPYCTQKQRTGKRCFYTHLGLCSPCPSEIVSFEGSKRSAATRAYRGNLRKLRALFEGKTAWLSDQLTREMRTLADAERFEEADAVKHRLAFLGQLSSYRYDPQVFIERGAEEIYRDELDDLLAALRRVYPAISSLSRIECMDISNLLGKHAVGSTVVLSDGRPDTSQYRRFRIRTVSGISDVAMMREMLSRRLNHPEWGLPDFLLIDGGKSQVAAVSGVLVDYAVRTGTVIPYAGLAKREEELVFYRDGSFTVLRLPLSGKGIKVVQRIRDEAHRFAITYHRLLRSKAFLGSGRV